ncbi:class I fructose-bisphosphate aldolase [Methylocaldum szegediense]|uniref:fructose-bisphosphate aldolase n=1 Tax=Methylocaldum szegediense TaxID=73780 RepID=A0ABM9I4P3_9GAMM|nr:class I fructose-bisphosphate aldolase [Methylocaldum szegediense]CAI8890532.1 putative fructose-bisphosphate aldolase class 1 [Methylocaldum szegediense]
MSEELTQIAANMVAPGKGLLAADESTGTLEKRFKKLGIECTEASRLAYREMLFTAPDLEKYISGVILFDETIRQRASDGTPIPELLARKGIIPGIKVDKGLVDLPFFPGERFTQGLDGLSARLDEYREMGARFTKWRAVIAIGEGIPTSQCLRANADALARYAGLCQVHGLVPIVEPEVLMDGSHDIKTCRWATEAALHEVFDALTRYRISFKEMILKPNMVVSGTDCSNQAPPDEVAEMTLACLRRTVPVAVPGIAFLSGGQSDVTATANLNAINVKAKTLKTPWTLTFSFSRALQAAPMSIWRGQAENKAAAQQALVRRARCNGAAALGQYDPGMEEA